MKYDDASWHYGGDFPKDLPPEAGATHIGMFVTWCLLNGLSGQLHVEHSRHLLDALKQRTLTPAAFFIQACDEKFTDEDLSEVGNLFAKTYFDSKTGGYLADYETALLGSHETLYHVSDSWESFDKLAPIISRRFQNWKKYGTVDEPAKPWWKLW